jgi:membrane fusion protein (multidrug efflux system)
MTGCGRKDEKAAKGAGAPPLFTVEVMTLQAKPLRETLAATGSLLPRESIRLQSEVAGLVREIHFEEGKLAKKGDVLVTIDDSELQAQLKRAEAQLELATTAEGRQRSLAKSRGISEADYDQSLANLHVAQAEVELIKTQVAKTRIVAPFDGVAGLRQVSLGAYLTPGTQICSFQDISSLKIDFALPERYLDVVKVGQTITFQVVGRSDEFQASVVAIEPAIDIATRSLMIRAVVPNEERRLLPGAFAQVEVQTDEIPNAITIPPIALIPGLQKQTVFLHKEGKVMEREVESSLRSSAAVQIVEGLEPGEELIVSGILQLRPGMKVQTIPVQVPSGTEMDDASSEARPVKATTKPKEVDQS